MLSGGESKCQWGGFQVPVGGILSASGGDSKCQWGILSASGGILSASGGDS